jgi:hypothetical protein
MNVAHEIDNVIDNLAALDEHLDTFRHARGLLKPSAPFTPDVNWDKLLMEMKHDLEDGLKSIKVLREAFDASQEVARG